MNHNIENFRSVISDYPKLWEWEAEFSNLSSDVLGPLSTKQLMVLSDNNQLPGAEVGTMSISYKGAQTNLGTRTSLDGEIELKFKEIKGPTIQESWLVRRMMKRWGFIVDDFFGKKKSIPQSKVVMTLTMQDETGKPIRRVKYYGVKPKEMAKLAITNEITEEYPVCTMTFTYDFWKEETITG